MSENPEGHFSGERILELGLGSQRDLRLQAARILVICAECLVVDLFVADVAPDLGCHPVKAGPVEYFMWLLSLEAGNAGHS